MNEERMFILKMVEEGKITAAEAAALLDALGDEGGGDRESEEKPKRSGPDLAAQIGETLQAALRQVPHWTEDVLESWNEVRNDLRQSLREMREELKKKKLIDLSGLTDLIAHMRDVGFGPAHEFEERLVGTFAPEGTLEVELVTRHGSITVVGWEHPSYEVVLRKKVYGRDEAAAREVAARAVEVERGEARLGVDAGSLSGVAVTIEVRLPKDREIALQATTTNGSLTVDGVRLTEGRVTTTNGSVRVRDVSASRLVAATVNGRVEGRRAVADSCEVRSVNGSVEWEGQSRRAHVRTVNGSIRCTPELPAEAGDGALGGWEVNSVNGSVRLLVTPSPEVGLSLEASARSVEIDEEGTGLATVSSEGKVVRRRVVARTAGYDDAARRLDITSKTLNGGVRVSGRSEKGGGAGAGEGRKDADPQDA